MLDSQESGQESPNSCEFGYLLPSLKVFLRLFLFLAARERSEATMRFNNFDNMIFGINITGQGINGVVEGTHVVGLRHLVTKLSRRLSLRLAVGVH